MTNEEYLNSVLEPLPNRLRASMRGKYAYMIGRGYSTEHHPNVAMEYAVRDANNWIREKVVKIKKAMNGETISPPLIGDKYGN